LYVISKPERVAFFTSIEGNLPQKSSGNLKDEPKY
jgi:hypothetical protein